MSFSTKARDWAMETLRGIGFNVTRARNSLTAKRADLLARYPISVVLDVGANIGDYGRLVRDAGYTGRIISFEPTAAAFGSLQGNIRGDDAWEASNIAIGDTDGRAVIHIADALVCSSLLNVTKASVEAASQSAQVGTETVTVRRLDSAFRPSATDVIYLKLDVQGYEQAALHGATGLLDQVVAIECEVSFTPLYEEQPLIGQMLVELDRLGYDLIWIERGLIDPRVGYMLQADILCLRRNWRRNSTIPT